MVVFLAGTPGFEPGRPVLETGSLPLSLRPLFLNNTGIKAYDKQNLLFLDLLVHGVLPAPLAELLQFDLALNGVFVLPGLVVELFALVASHFY